MPPDGYLKGVRELCDRYGIVMIADEVMTGFGRTGEWFAIEHYGGVVPDMITIAKGVTSGYVPLGGVAISPTLSRRRSTTGPTWRAHLLRASFGDRCGRCDDHCDA